METARIALPIWVFRTKTNKEPKTTQLIIIARNMFFEMETPCRWATPGMSGHMALGAGENIRMINDCMTTARMRVEISMAIGLS
jgi:hypothetical protein